MLKYNSKKLKTLNFSICALSFFTNNHARMDKPEIISENDKQFVIVTTAFKAKKWYQKCLDSVVSQTYPHWELIYIADGDGLPQSDGTGDAVQEYIKENNLESKITLIRNATRKDKLCNVYDAIHMCDKKKIVVMLDYDDWFYDNTVLEYLNQVYQEPHKGNDVWLTYGQCIFWPSGDIGIAREIPEEIVNTNNFRNYEFVSSHLKTFYAGLFHKIKREDLIWKDSLFIPYIDDVAFMLYLLELAGTHSRFIPRILYVFNHESGWNHANTWLSATVNDFHLMDQFIRRKPKYEPVLSPF